MGRADFVMLMFIGTVLTYAASMAFVSGTYHRRGMNPNVAAPLGFSIFYSIGVGVLFFFHMLAAYLPIWHLYLRANSMGVLLFCSVLFGFCCFKSLRANRNDFWHNTLSRPLRKDTLFWIITCVTPAVTWWLWG